MTPPAISDEPRRTPGRLRARPHAVSNEARTGLVELPVFRARSALLYVPTGYRADHPAALAVLLHGSGGAPRHALAALFAEAERARLMLLAPASRSFTWDGVLGESRDDAEVLDGVLEQVFADYAVNPAHLAIGGFSDGASYALSLGLANGDLFSHVIAFSPGYLAARQREGEPRVFVSHGTQDAVLPVERCGRRIAAALERDGLRVAYREFAGGHAIPPDVARDAASWFLGAES